MTKKPKNGTGMKPVPRFLLPMILLALLTSCNRSVKQPQMPSVEPIPTIECHEHEPSEHLPPPFQAPSVGSPNDYGAESPGKQARDYADLYRYAVDESKWGIAATGVYQRTNDKRHITADCLDKYRAAGVIH